MEKSTPPQDDRLFDYLDGLLDEPEARQLEAVLQRSPEMKARLEELKTIRQSLTAAARLESPSKNFTTRVMDHLESYPVSGGISPRNGILLLCGILVAVGIGLILLRAGTFDTSNSPIGLDALPIKEEWTKNLMPAISFNGKLFMKTILIVATGLSFLLLDRTILRPLFNRRSGMQF